MKRILFAAAAGAAVSGACYAAVVHTVDQRGLAFSVARMTIRKGEVVRFSNHDATPHNILISAGGKLINSGLQQPGVDFKAPFARSGAYQVTCGIHPKMKMEVVVE